MRWNGDLPRWHERQAFLGGLNSSMGSEVCRQIYVTMWLEKGQAPHAFS